MKKICLTGVIIILIAIWIWYFLEINHSDNNESTQWETGYNEESISQTLLTWDEDDQQPELDVEQETWEIEESEEKIEEKVEENVKEPEVENIYPIYWVIENAYCDESAQWEEDENIQETEDKSTRWGYEKRRKSIKYNSNNWLKKLYSWIGR